MVTIPQASGLLIAVATITATSSATAQPVATVRVVSCDTGDCLLVRGHRRSSQAIVRINGRKVDAIGRTAWSVRLPVATVRDWSAPFARSLRIAVVDPTDPREHSDAVRLPMGLLGSRMELASLIVRAR